MSLLDLHKRATRAKSLSGDNRSMKQNIAVSADDFINEAISYAQGLDNVVPLHQDAGRLNDAKPLTHVPLTLVSNDTSLLKAAKVPYRRATFTLSEPCIKSLAELAQQTDAPNHNWFVCLSVNLSNYRKKSNNSCI